MAAGLDSLAVGISTRPGTEPRWLGRLSNKNDLQAWPRALLSFSTLTRECSRNNDQDFGQSPSLSSDSLRPSYLSQSRGAWITGMIRYVLRCHPVDVPACGVAHIWRPFCCFWRRPLCAMDQLDDRHNARQDSALTVRVDLWLGCHLIMERLWLGHGFGTSGLPIA